MTTQEFSDQFDVLYNNITSNQAAGLNEYEKSLFLTKAQYEMVKNYFLPQGNPKQEGFDDNPKRQADFATLVRSYKADVVARTAGSADTNIIDIRTRGVYGASWPGDIFIMLNELVFDTNKVPLTIVPLSYEEYSRLMAKPYKYPPKNQVWRLIVSNNQSGDSVSVNPNGTTVVSSTASTTTYTNQVEVQLVSLRINASDGYTLRYVKKPRPIILEDLTASNLSIDGVTSAQTSELPAELHEEILQRAVELAKIAWTATGQDNVQTVIQAGQRSE